MHVYEWNIDVIREQVHASMCGCDSTILDNTHRVIFLKSCSFKLKSDCIYHFPIDLGPNGRPFGSKSIGK